MGNVFYPDDIRNWCFATNTWEVGDVLVDLQLGGSFNLEMRSKDKTEKFDFGGVYTNVEFEKTASYIMSDNRKVIINFETKGKNTKVSIKFDPEKENSEELQKLGWGQILENFKIWVERLSLAGKRILYLPGNSKKNIIEKEIFFSFFKNISEIYAHDYQHWNIPDGRIDIELELEILKKVVNENEFDVIISKSIGSLLAVRLMKLYNFKYKYILGLPLIDLSEEELGEYPKEGFCIFQNDKDNRGNFSEVKKTFPFQRIIKLDANDHRYKIPFLVYSDLKSSLQML